MIGNSLVKFVSKFYPTFNQLSFLELSRPGLVIGCLVDQSRDIALQFILTKTVKFYTDEIANLLLLNSLSGAYDLLYRAASFMS